MLTGGHGQRAYSIRTRIKTLTGGHAVPLMFPVREHIPLEQGLRLLRTASSESIASVREHIPLEQGLRQFLDFCK